MKIFSPASYSVVQKGADVLNRVNVIKMLGFDLQEVTQYAGPYGTLPEIFKDLGQDECVIYTRDSKYIYCKYDGVWKAEEVSFETVKKWAEDGKIGHAYMEI